MCCANLHCKLLNLIMIFCRSSAFLLKRLTGIDSFAGQNGDHHMEKQQLKQACQGKFKD